MPFSRYTESQLRQLVDALGVVDGGAPEDVLRRLEQLQRGLEPEDEFSLVLSWLGQCRLVHKLGQEQLPLESIGTYRVPDLLAVLDFNGRNIPVLIEVKHTEMADPSSLEEGILSLKPGYLSYAEALGLPLLIAWKHRTFWTLFDIRHAELAITNYKIGFFRAMQENLLSLLAGDFSYRVVPGTAIRMRIKKLTPRDADGGFRGVIDDTYFVNAKGERLPDIPQLASLFLFWENEVELTEDGDAIIQSFVIPDFEHGEFASRTLGKVIGAFAAMRKERINWRSVIHDKAHWAHDSGRLRQVVEQGAKHGVITDIFHFKPRRTPDFLGSL